MTTTTAPAMTALVFYSTALPQIEALCDLARQWRSAEPTATEAAEMYSAFFWLSLRLDLKLSRCRVSAGTH